MKENRIPVSLINEFKNNNVVLFIGAGISMNAGLPSWKSLLNSLNQILITHDKESSEFYKYCDDLQKAQFLYDNIDKISVVNEIRSIFNRVNVNSKVCDEIITLPLNSIITTNWDTLVEDTFTKNKQPITKVWKDEQISSIVLGSKTILKIHGTIEEPEGIVFSEDDYYDSFNNNPILKQYLSTIISTNAVLMIGYSFSDFDFKLIYKFIKQNIGKTARKIYILVLNSSKYQVNYFKERGLIPIEYYANSYDSAISLFFKQLTKAVSIYSRNSKERLQILARENFEIKQKYGEIIIRNISSLGPLATPDQPMDDLFGENTKLEVECATNWKGILEKDGSSAKCILCLNIDNKRNIFAKEGYLLRVETLIKNMEKYKDKVEFIDSGSPLITSNWDIYGNYVSLESISTDVNTMGYSYINVQHDITQVSEQIHIFDATFNSIKEANKLEAIDRFSKKTYSEGMIHKMLIEKLKEIRKKIQKEW